jgi:hypothetical protein
MSISFCTACEQIVEGDTIGFVCEECYSEYVICRRCHEANVIELSEDDPREER